MATLRYASSNGDDPFRNLEQDTQDALQHAEQMDENVPDYVWHVTKHPRMSLKKVLTLDDVSSWGEWAAGELKELSPDELFEHMRSFRGRAWAETALTWARDGFPAIVVTETPEYVGISDGRGRVSLAYGLGVTNIPVVMMKADPLTHQTRRNGSDWMADAHKRQHPTKRAGVTVQSVEEIRQGVYQVVVDLGPKGVHNVRLYSNGQLESGTISRDDLRKWDGSDNPLATKIKAAIAAHVR